jgi:predicted nucleotidyltransferase
MTSIDPFRPRIAELCRQYGVSRLDVFGSILRPDFSTTTSDVDFAVEFDAAHSGSPLHRYFDLKTALEGLFGRKVDLVELGAMQDTRLKREITRSKLPIYAAAS